MVVELSQSLSSDRLVRCFKALSDKTRLAIFLLIRERCCQGRRVSEDQIGQTVSAIAREFHVSMSTVSHHVRELKNAGLIRCEKRGQWVHCSPDPTALEAMRAFLTREE